MSHYDKFYEERERKEREELDRIKRQIESTVSPLIEELFSKSGGLYNLTKRRGGSDYYSQYEAKLMEAKFWFNKTLDSI